MRAVRIDRHGGIDVLELREVPAPVPAPGEVLIRTIVGSINPVDWKTRAWSDLAAIPARILTAAPATIPLVDPAALPLAGLTSVHPRPALIPGGRYVSITQLTVVWFLWDGETFRFTTTRSRAKYLNLRRDPSISLLVDDFEKKFYVVAYGRAQLIEKGHDALAKPLLEKYMPEKTVDPQWTPDRVIVELRPARILTGR